MKGFLQKILNKKILLLIIAILTIGSGTVIANAWGTCGGSSCGCTSSNSDAASNGTCAAPTTCWYNSAGTDGCRGHDWYKITSVYQYSEGSATCTSGATIVDVYKTTYGCNKCPAGKVEYTRSSYTTGALGHAEGSYSSINSSQHQSKCSRCGDTHTGSHSFSGWINSGQGYEYKTCNSSSTDTSGHHNLTDSNGCGATSTNYYTLNLTLNANGGTINGQTTTSQSPKYNANATLPTPTRAGYTFKGWGYNANTYGVSFNAGSVTPVSINENLKNGDSSATLYAQWEKTVKYSINYMTSSGTTTNQYFYVVFRNHATSASVTSFTNGNYYYTDSLTSVVFSGNTSISSFNDGSTVTKNGYSDWKERGLAKSNSTSYASTLTSTMSVSINDVSASSGTIYYYNSYQRKPTITYVDYATNVRKSRTLTGSITIGGTAYNTAGMKYNGTVDRKPVFTFPTQNTMVYGEALSSGVKKNETWTSTGWSTDKTAKYKTYKSGTNLGMGTSYVSSSGTSKMASYGTYTYYGNYQKAVKLTYNPNGGTVNTSSVSYVRYANINSSTPTTTTKTYNAPNAYYKDSSSGLTIYTQESWTYVAPSSSNNYWINNEDYRDVISFNNTGTGYYSDNKTIWQYAPLVTETVYATWTNESNDVTVLKDAVWDNPKSDNINVDFEGLENIDVDGIAKVTLTVTLNPSSTQYVANNLYIEDYFNTDMWDFVSTNTKNLGIDTSGTNAGTIKWTIGNVTVNKKTTIKATYYLRLKEEYWTIDADGNKVTDYINYYINPMNAKGTYAKSVQRYLDSLEGTINSDGTYDVSKVSLDRDDMYYKESKNAHKSYVYVSYHYDTNDIDGTQRYVAYPVDYVQMRDVDWKPEVATDISISSDTNNIYKITGKDNAYFVQYDTHSTNNSANSVFKLNMNSMLDRSSLFYQITNNVLCIDNILNTKGAIDNFIAIDSDNENLVFDASQIPSTKQKSYTYTTDNSILKVKSALSIRQSIANKLSDSRTAYYLNGAVSTQDIVYATNQDGLTFDIVPNVLITDADDNKTYNFTDASKKITLTIDASNPVIKADSRIRTESESGQQWTASDGYVDINLVDNKTNPEAKAHTLTFTFEDAVSGVNNPSSKGDWINLINDNVQVTLKNVDINKVLFDATSEKENVQNDYSKITDIIKVTYNSANSVGINNGGSITLTLDPNNEDLLGHLQLTIKVIDNVGNWEEKTYDIYSFCLTGNVNVVDTLPSADKRNEAEIWNGEQGKIQISANGWVDRVSVDFEYSLVEASKKELTKRNNITGDEYKINGDYPLDDSNLTGDGTKLYYYLPTEYLKCKWGYVNGELGGLPLSLAKLSTVEYTLNNDILNTHLNELIANYIAKETGGYVENVNGSNYAIYGTTLYTYPIYKGDTVDSYVDSYTFDGSIIIDETPYPQCVIINGSQYATITYTETDDGYVASIEEQTIITSNWVKIGDEYYKPLEHYFYMPTYAEVRNGEKSNDHYIVQLTAYKDSDTDFVHTVSIQLTMTNDNYGGSLKDLQTNIKDN